MGKMRDIARNLMGGSKPSSGPLRPGAGHNSPPGEDEGQPGNYIKTYRSLRYHSVVGFDWSKPRTPFEAWYDLLCMAKYKPEEVISRGRKVHLDRGQLVAARGWLAKRWLWTEYQVRSWMADLERDGSVIWTHASTGVSEEDRLPFRPIVRPTHDLLSDGTPRPIKTTTMHRAASVLTICNYSKYQHYESVIEEYVATTKSHVSAPTNRPDQDLKRDLNSRQSIKEIIDINNNPPTPFKGEGERSVAYANGKANGHTHDDAVFTLTPDPVSPRRVRKRKTVGLHGLTPEQLDEAYLVLNGAYNYKIADRSEDRDQKLARRIEEIGGMANFRRAIASIRFDDFFAGKTPARPPATRPFRFTFDTLLSKQLGHNKVNVLMALLDIAKERSVLEQSGERPVTAEDIERWTEQQQEAAIVAALKSKGSWVLSKWWRAPGHIDCRFRKGLIAKYRLTEIFDEHGLRRSDSQRVQAEVRVAMFGQAAGVSA